jgi:ABC-type sugar transport system permease subunit
VLRREGRSGYALVAPTTVLLAIFYLFPLIETAYYSFTDWNPATPGALHYEGFSNYKELFTGGGSSGTYGAALVHTLLFVAVMVPCSMLIGLLLAALMVKPFRGRALYRTLIFTPVIAPIVGSSLIFSYMLSPLGGIVNDVLQVFDIAPINFLQTTPWAMVTLIGFSVWQQVGYNMILYSAALTAIPASYLEAATLDGAGAIRRFYRISFPLVAPTTAFLVVTGILGALQVFTQVYTLTEGGPLQSTTTAIFWIYQQGFEFFHGGLATAASMLLFAFGMVITLVQLRYLNRRDAAPLS